MSRTFVAAEALPDWVLTDARVGTFVESHLSWGGRNADNRLAARMAWALMARYGIPLDQQVAAVHFVGFGYALAQLGDWPVEAEDLRVPPLTPEARLEAVREFCCTHADVFEGVRKQKDILIGLMDNDIDADLWWVAIPLLELGYGIIPLQALP